MSSLCLGDAGLMTEEKRWQNYMLVLGTWSMSSHLMAKPNHTAKSGVYSVETNSPFMEYYGRNELGREGKWFALGRKGGGARCGCLISLTLQLLKKKSSRGKLGSLGVIWG